MIYNPYSHAIAFLVPELIVCCRLFDIDKSSEKSYDRAFSYLEFSLGNEKLLD